MISIIRSDERYNAVHDWLDARFSFSFAEYYDPNNMQFGSLRVLNDDIIQPKTGFGMHPHKDMEILTYVIEGELRHEDNMGNVGIIKAEEIQIMSAGTGIWHSEHNNSEDKVLNLLQIWILPDKKGIPTRWEHKKFSKEDKINKLVPIASGNPSDSAMKINQDVEIYSSILEKEEILKYETDKFRKTYIFVVSGSLFINDEIELNSRDQVRITELSELKIKANKDTEFLLMDLK